jgi:hypothetical protein
MGDFDPSQMQSTFINNMLDFNFGNMGGMGGMGGMGMGGMGGMGGM